MDEIPIITSGAFVNWFDKNTHDHIYGSVHVGSQEAAKNAEQLGFTHVLNCAEELDIDCSPNIIVYHKISMKDMQWNRIEDYKIEEAVMWLAEHDHPENKILVNCFAGIGRSGSAAVAYVFASNPSMSFEEARTLVRSKRFVSPHHGLAETLNRLFPRTN